MGSFLVVLLTIIGVILAICFVHYIWTLPQKRENEERWRREVLLFEEKREAEKAKQSARIAGAITRENINKIAKSK